MSNVINSRVALPADDSRLARPIFTLREAAGHLTMPASTLHRWAHDRAHSPMVVTVGAGRRQRLDAVRRVR